MVRSAGRQSVKARRRDEGSEANDTGQWSRDASVRAEPEVRIHGSHRPPREQILRAGLTLLHGSAGASRAEPKKGSQNKAPHRELKTPQAVRGRAPGSQGLILLPLCVSSSASSSRLPLPPHPGSGPSIRRMDHYNSITGLPACSLSFSSFFATAFSGSF